MGNFGTKIKQFREEKRWQQKELALAVGISQSHLSKIEANYITPNAELLKKIAHFLHLPVDEFYETGNKKTSADTNNNPHHTYTGHSKNSLQNENEELKRKLEYQQNVIVLKNSIISQQNETIESLKKQLRKN